MKEALYYKKEKDHIKCMLCPRLCRIPDGKTGFCGARKNIDSTLYTLNYAKPVSIAIDPIEKKPLFHFLPGAAVLSFGTYGCNLSCLNCQNYSISMERDRQPDTEMPVEKIVRSALVNKCQGIAYTYNEPTIFFEYMLDIARLAKSKGLKNILVSNGYINKKPLLELCGYIDAANIDLKGFTDEFYKKTCSARLKPVLNTLKTLKNEGIWLEITNLLIPGLNDNPGEIGKMLSWIEKNLGKDVPLHLSKFHPDYRLAHLKETPAKTILDAKQLADNHLNYVYAGNMYPNNIENTYCPCCKSLLVKRSGYPVLQNSIIHGKCPLCKAEIAGIWGE